MPTLSSSETVKKAAMELTDVLIYITPEEPF